MNPPRHKGLGRGLDALLAANSGGDAVHQETLPVTALQPGKYQPRTHMDQDSLRELAASIKAQGVMQPILVRPLGGGRFEIIAGERRWRAAQLAGVAQVPTLIRDIADEAALAMSLIENIQRENLNPLEEAAGLQRLIDEFGMTHQQAADAVGRSRPAASNLLRLLHLAKPVQEALFAGTLDMGHGRALLSLSKLDQAKIAAIVAKKGMSVRETERLVARQLQPQAKKHDGRAANRDLLRLEEELADAIGAQVKVLAKAGGTGTLAIRYASLEQLDGIIERLKA